MVHNNWLYYKYMASEGYVNLNNLCGITIGKLNNLDPPDWYKIPENFDDLFVIKAIQDGSHVCIYQGEIDQAQKRFDQIMHNMTNRDDWIKSSYNKLPVAVNITKATEFKVEYGIEIHACYHKIGIPFKNVSSTELGYQYLTQLIMRSK